MARMTALITKAILESLSSEGSTSASLVEDVSERTGKKVSAKQIMMYLHHLYHAKKVDRERLTRETWIYFPLGVER